MEKIVLQKRELVGKKIKSLRKEDLVPSVIYNSKGESTNVSIDKRTAIQLYKIATSTTVLDVEIGKEKYKAIVKDFDIDPRTDNILHVAFFEINPKDSMIFTIPFTLEGVSPAVKNNLGILVQVLDSLTVRCTLENLVSNITLNVGNLEVPGQTISVNDIELPKNVELLHKKDATATIVTITQLQKIEVIEEEEEDEEVDDGTEVEEGEEGEEEASTEEGGEEEVKE
ncbi:50S ribosomal protein L25 [bacterium]|nr:50S ribosomal protein L25 [bacterium]